MTPTGLYHLNTSESGAAGTVEDVHSTPDWHRLPNWGSDRIEFDWAWGPRVHPYDRVRAAQSSLLGSAVD
jgi:hypothetical protein